MSQWIKSKVVMLPIEKVDNTKPMLWLGRISNQLKYDRYGTGWIDDSVLTQHLYILSNEEIKEGDWFYGGGMFKPEQAKLIEGSFVNGFIKSACNKIIATTDKLATEPFQGFYGNIDCTNYLPQPSPQFIQKYIEEWNKGNKITEVMVKYEEETDFGDEYSEIEVEEMIDTNTIPLKLKVDKNNQITITKVKDSWSRDEVISLLRNCLEATGKEIRAEMKSIPISPYIEFSGDDFDEWVEKNV